MFDVSREERQKYLNQMFTLPTYEVLHNDYKEHKARVPSVEENLSIQLNNYAIITGKRLFIAPNIFGGGTERLLPDTARKYDYVIAISLRDIDSVEIKIPPGYKPEMLPKDVTIQNKLGKYVASVRVTDNKITYQRLWEQYSGRCPATEYNELVKFYEQIFKADRSKVVLVKTE
jgi:hypothetical protein